MGSICSPYFFCKIVNKYLKCISVCYTIWTTERREKNMETYVRTDRNGNDHHESDICPRCNGTGKVNHTNWDNGTCFKCNGTGIHHHRWIVYSDEYLDKHNKYSENKLDASSANSKHFDRFGADRDGNVWIVTGETYSIKNQIKNAGGKFQWLLKWYFNHDPEQFKTEKVNLHDIFPTTAIGEIDLNDTEEAYENWKRRTIK